MVRDEHQGGSANALGGEALEDPGGRVEDELEARGSLGGEPAAAREGGALAVPGAEDLENHD